MKKTVKTKSKIKGQKPDNKPTLVCLLLDRSGSMQSFKTETISGFNDYVDGLKSDKDMRFTITQFDSVAVDVIHDAVPNNRVDRLNEANYKPRSYTPLYDAIGKTIRSAEQYQDQYKVLFVVQTDGQENTSKEWNSTSIKDLIKSKEDQNKWTFVYLGMGPQGWDQLERMSYGTQSVGNNMKFTGATSKKAYQNMAKATKMYSRAGGQGVNCVSMSFFSDAGVDKDQTK